MIRSQRLLHLRIAKIHHAGEPDIDGEHDVRREQRATAARHIRAHLLDGRDGIVGQVEHLETALAVVTPTVSLRTQRAKRREPLLDERQSDEARAGALVGAQGQAGHCRGQGHPSLQVV